MRLLVISDLHAINESEENKPKPSLIEIAGTQRTPTADPLIGLLQQFDNHSLDIPDVLVCAGDLADKADPLALRQVWSELSEIQRKYEIPALIGTCGNHDLDSRHQSNKFDPKGFLRKLEPPFPFANYSRSDHTQLSYWADNYSLIEGNDYRILNINSCAYHGYGKDVEPELSHGRLSDYTIADIRDTLENIGAEINQKFNICIFHHHLQPISSDTYDDRSKMLGAENLTQLLSESRLGEWFVIHGHRHSADLYCAGGNSAPFVLSCGSFAATNSGDVGNPSPNQFYMIEFDPPRNDRARIKGQVKAWTFSPSYGWTNWAQQPAGLPPNSGFGFRGDIHDFADKIAEHVRKDGRLKWADASVTFEEIKNFLPQDLSNLETALNAIEGIHVSVDGRKITEIVRT